MTEPAAIFTFVGNHLWQSALLGVALAGALAFGRRLSAGQRHTLAFATLAAVAVLPLAALLPGGGLLDRFAAEAQAAAPLNARPAPSVVEPATRRAPTHADANAFTEPPLVTFTFGRSPSVTLDPARPSASTSSVAYEPPAGEEAALSRGGFPSLGAVTPALAIGLGLVWGLGAAVFLFRVGLDVCAAERLRMRAASRALPSALPATLRALCVRESAEVQGPLVVGLVNPTVILPAGALDRYTNHELRALLEHERAHIERNDLMLALLQRILVSLIWWSPAMHWIARRIDDEREMACDEAAAARLGDARAFAKALTAHAHARLLGPRLAMGAAVGRSQLGRRVRRLIERAGTSVGSARVARGAAGMLAAVVAVAAVATPRLEAQTPSSDAVPAPAAPAAPEAPRAPDMPRTAAAAVSLERARAEVAAKMAALEEAQHRLQLEMREMLRAGAEIDEARIDALGDEIGVLAEELARTIGEASSDTVRRTVEIARRNPATTYTQLGGNGRNVEIEHHFEGVDNDGEPFNWVFAGADAPSIVSAIGAPNMSFRVFSLEDETPLAAAVRQGDADMVRVLIEAGADVNGDGSSMGSPLTIAMRAGNPEIIALLLDNGANVDGAGVGNGDTPLLSAIRSGDGELVQQLINAGADVNVRGANGETPLKLAVRTGDSQMVRLLVDAGADPNGGLAEED